MVCEIIFIGYDVLQSRSLQAIRFLMYSNFMAISKYHVEVYWSSDFLMMFSLNHISFTWIPQILYVYHYGQHNYIGQVSPLLGMTPVCHLTSSNWYSRFDRQAFALSARAMTLSWHFWCFFHMRHNYNTSTKNTVFQAHSFQFHTEVPIRIWIL